MKTVTIDVSEYGECAIGAVSAGMSPGLAYAILEDYQSAINPGMSVLGVLPRGQDGKSEPYWVYDWEELGDLALEHADLVRVRVVGPGARQEPDWLEVAVDVVAEAASAPEMRRGARDDLDITEGAFARYVLAEMGLGWVSQHPYASLENMAKGLKAAADDLMSGARALGNLSYTHKVWMQAKEEATDEG